MRELPRIETDRLILRPLRPDDLDALHALWTDPGVRSWLWDGRKIGRGRARNVMRASRASVESEGFGLWGVCVSGEDELIGFCGFRRVEYGDDIEILFGIAPVHWRRGYATEAAEAAVREGFERHGWERIVAWTDRPNLASRRVIEKLGFRYDRRERRGGGTLDVYSISREMAEFVLGDR